MRKLWGLGFGASWGSEDFRGWGLGFRALALGAVPAPVSSQAPCKRGGGKGKGGGGGRGGDPIHADRYPETNTLDFPPKPRS